MGAINMDMTDNILLFLVFLIGLNAGLILLGCICNIVEFIILKIKGE